MTTTIKPYWGNENTDGTSFPPKPLDEIMNWGEHSGSLRYGVVMLRGWKYDLRPYLKKYLVKGWYDSGVWRETFAKNKAQARVLVGDHSKCRVIELKENENA